MWTTLSCDDIKLTLIKPKRNFCNHQLILNDSVQVFAISGFVYCEPKSAIDENTEIMDKTT